MKIRAASLADKSLYLDSARRLRPAASEGELGRDWQQIIEKRGQHAALLCVDAEDQLLGMVELSRRLLVAGLGPGPVAYVDGLHVETGQAREQVAARLLEAAESWAHTRGCAQMVADAGVDDQWDQKLHVQLGFEEIARRVIYRKPVPRDASRVAVAQVPADAPPVLGPTEPVVSVEPDLRSPVATPRRGPGAVHLTLFALGILAFVFTDVWHGNAFTGVLLPIFDIAFVIYVIGFIMSVKYKRRTDASERTMSLYDRPEEGHAEREP
jgi:aminoglycoside 6'-N-acetyltransferase I